MNRIEKLRYSFGFTQEEFSEIMGLTKRQIINLEHGKSRITDKTAIICELINRLDIYELEDVIKKSRRWKE